MIYLKNNTETQSIYIPRQTVLGGGYIPSTKAYDKGYNDGLEVGKEQQKGKLSNLNVTANGQYEREDGWNVVNVDVPDLNGSYEEGYRQGHTEGYAEGEGVGYNQGKIEGINEQKGKLESINIIGNGVYSKEDGYNHIEVNVPDLNGSYDQGYAQGHTEGYNEGRAEGEGIGYNQGQADLATNARVLEVTKNGQYKSKYSDPIIPANYTVTGVYADGTEFYSYAELNGKIFNTKIAGSINSRLEFWYKGDNTKSGDGNNVIIGSGDKNTYDSFQVRYYDGNNNIIRVQLDSSIGDIYNWDDTVWHHLIISKTEGIWVDERHEYGPLNYVYTINGEFFINGIGYDISGTNTANGYFGMIKIDDVVIIPTADGFKNVNTGELLEVVKDGTYNFTENLPIYGEGELYKTINVNVPDLNGSYDEGKTDGINEQKSKLEAINITENGTYTKEDGYNHIEVNVSTEAVSCNLISPIVFSKEAGNTINAENVQIPTFVYEGNQYYNVDSFNLADREEFKIHILFKPNNRGDAEPVNIFGCEDTDWDNTTFGARIYQGQIYFRMSGEDVAYPYTENTWYNVEMGYNTTKRWVIVNGETLLDAEYASFNRPRQTLMIGAINSGGNALRPFYGKIATIYVEPNGGQVWLLPKENGTMDVYWNTKTNRYKSISGDNNARFENDYISGDGMKSITWLGNLEDKWVTPSMNDRDSNGYIVVSPSEGYSGLKRTVINPQTIYNEGLEAGRAECVCPSAQEQSFDYDITAFTYKVYDWASVNINRNNMTNDCGDRPLDCLLFRNRSGECTVMTKFDTCSGTARLENGWNGDNIILSLKSNTITKFSSNSINSNQLTSIDTGFAKLEGNAITNCSALTDIKVTVLNNDLSTQFATNCFYGLPAEGTITISKNVDVTITDDEITSFFRTIVGQGWTITIKQ